MIQKNYFKFIAVGLFLLGTVSLVVGYSFNYLNIQASNLSSGFKVTYHQTGENSDSSGRLLQAIIERQQQSNGEWKETVLWFDLDGKTVVKKTEKYAINGRGLYKVDEQNKRLVFLGLRPEVPVVPAPEDLRKNPDFVREDSILGYQTFVSRQAFDESNFTEVYAAPSLQGVPLKIIIGSGESKTIIEAVKVEPEDKIISTSMETPNYPISYESFEKGIKSMERGGNVQEAEQMRQELNRRKDNER